MLRELFVVVRYEGKLERIHRVEATETTIGRAPNNVLCLPDPWVSRTHAVVIQTSNDYLIRDLGSRNGTRLNGHSVIEAVLPPAGIIEIGPYRLNAFRNLAEANSSAEGEDDTTASLPLHVLTAPDRELREQQLTPAQRRVYDEFLKGRSEKEAAHALKLSIHTVHSHSHAIYVKFGVSSRAELLSLCAIQSTLHD